MLCQQGTPPHASGGIGSGASSDAGKGAGSDAGSGANGGADSGAGSGAGSGADSGARSGAGSGAGKGAGSGARNGAGSGAGKNVGSCESSGSQAEADAGNKRPGDGDPGSSKETNKRALPDRWSEMSRNEKKRWRNRKGLKWWSSLLERDRTRTASE